MTGAASLPPTTSRSCSSHGPMSHCAAHQVTHALSFALNAGKGRANRMRNHHSSPVSFGGPGGQSGNSSLSVRRDRSVTVVREPELEWRYAMRSIKPS
jgi:hypothetical protein